MPSGFIRQMVVVRIAAIADVARRADRHVQQAVGAEPDELPSVMPVGRKLVGDDRGRARGLELRLDVVEAEDAVDLGDIQRAVAERDAVRHVEAADDGDDAIGLAVLVLVAQRVDVAGAPLPTNTVPPGLCASDRALRTPSAQTEI